MTYVGLFFGVTSLMLQNVSLKSESLRTKFTLVLLFYPCVCCRMTGAHVGPEITSGFELLGTNVALVSSHACVGGHMVITEGFASEKLGTNIALEAQVTMDSNFMVTTQLL